MPFPQWLRCPPSRSAQLGTVSQDSLQSSYEQLFQSTENRPPVDINCSYTRASRPPPLSSPDWSPPVHEEFQMNSSYLCFWPSLPQVHKSSDVVFLCSCSSVLRFWASSLLCNLSEFHCISLVDISASYLLSRLNVVLENRDIYNLTLSSQNLPWYLE